MKQTNLSLFLVSFVIGFVLVLGLTATTSAQPRIVPPEGATPACLQLFNELYDDGTISMDDAIRLTAYCVDSDRTMISFYEHLYDSLNGPGARPHFGNMAAVIDAFTLCREVVACPEDPENPPRDTPRSERRTLVLDCRGDVSHIEGRNNSRVCVCNGESQPFEIEPYHGRTETGERHHWERLVDVSIVYCLDPHNPAAPPIAGRLGDVDLSSIYERLNHLELGCFPGGMRERSAAWDELCGRFGDTLITGDYVTVANFITAIDGINAQFEALRLRVDRLEDDAAADCGLTREEWLALTAEQVRRMHDEGECEEASTTVVNHGDWRLHLHLGLAFHGLGITAPAGILAPHGVVYAEFEALPVEHFGFFLRGYIGAGNLLDRIGQFNPEGTIGDEGIFGGSAGPTFRINDMLAIDVGLAASAVFNPGGQIGRSLHTWPVFQLGGEARLRVNPVDWLHIEGTVGLDYTHAEVRRPNFDHFIGIDGVGYHLIIGAGVTF